MFHLLIYSPPFFRPITSQVCRCPLCKKTFQKRPNLQINRTLREITEQFKAMRRGGGTVGGKRGDRGNPCPFVEDMKQSKSMKKLIVPASKDSGEIQIGLDW